MAIYSKLTDFIGNTPLMELTYKFTSGIYNGCIKMIVPQNSDITEITN